MIRFSTSQNMLPKSFEYVLRASSAYLFQSAVDAGMYFIIGRDSKKTDNGLVALFITCPKLSICSTNGLLVD